MGYYDDIKNKYQIEELNSNTFEYRINGFIKACSMDLDNCVFSKEISPLHIPYINTNSDEEGLKYNINFSYHFHQENGKNYVMNGTYNDLEFVFTNYYKNDKNKNRINDLPFWITISEKVNNTSYTIRMDTIVSTMVKFIIIKTDEERSDRLVFYANTRNFSNVLKLIKSFVGNPELIYNHYDKIMNEKEVIFSTNELCSPLIDDKELDIPKKKMLKKIK